MEKLLAERREVRRLLQSLTQAKAHADQAAAEAIEQKLYDLLVAPLELSAYERPTKWNIGSVLAGVLLGYTRLELFDSPAKVFDHLGRAGSVHGWEPRVLGRILDLCAPLDRVLIGDAA